MGPLLNFQQAHQTTHPPQYDFLLILLKKYVLSVGNYHTPLQTLDANVFRTYFNYKPRALIISLDCVHYWSYVWHMIQNTHSSVDSHTAPSTPSFVSQLGTCSVKACLPSLQCFIVVMTTLYILIKSIRNNAAHWLKYTDSPTLIQMWTKTCILSCLNICFTDYFTYFPHFFTAALLPNQCQYWTHNSIIFQLVTDLLFTSSGGSSYQRLIV